MSHAVPVQMLGQSGCRLSLPGTVLYIDPYLSNSVQELDAPDINRLKPIPYPPESVTDADWVLVTHDHIDHCDPHTLPKLAAASPQCRFMGPPSVRNHLLSWGIMPERLFAATENWQPISANLRVHAIPAAHPEVKRDSLGQLACVGYLLEVNGKRIYMAGDTSVTQEILDAIKVHGAVEVAFLPVNEHNFFRGRRGIIGNMSIRDAFKMAEEIESRQVVAVHWDMFEINSVDPAEIRTVHQRMGTNFQLLIDPISLEI